MKLQIATIPQGNPTLEQLKARVEHYPYYQTARLLYLEALKEQGDRSLSEELRRAALFVADPTSLFMLARGDYAPAASPTPAVQAPPAAPQPARPAPQVAPAATPPASSEPQAPRPPQPKRRLTVVDAATDYVAYMLQAEEDEAAARQTPAPAAHTPSHTDQLIDNFIEHSSERISLSAAPTQLPDIAINGGQTTDNDEDYFTETLSRIYIKQGRYEQAIEIIRKLMLDYPKKNSYFADQIRFLEKLIINNKTTK